MLTETFLVRKKVFELVKLHDFMFKSLRYLTFLQFLRRDALLHLQGLDNGMSEYEATL